MNWLSKQWEHYLYRNGDQFPCMLGLSVCQYFFSFLTFSPEALPSLHTCSLISPELRLGTGTTWLLPFTTEENVHTIIIIIATYVKVPQKHLQCEHFHDWSVKAPKQAEGGEPYPPILKYRYCITLTKLSDESWMSAWTESDIDCCVRGFFG